MNMFIAAYSPNSDKGSWGYDLTSDVLNVRFRCPSCSKESLISSFQFNGFGMYVDLKGDFLPWGCSGCGHLLDGLSLNCWGRFPEGFFPSPQLVYQNAVEKRLFTEISPEVSSIAHLHAEVTELYEAVRDGNYEAVGEEMADIVLLVFSFAGLMGVDIEKEVTSKFRKILARRPRPGRGKI